MKARPIIFSTPMIQALLDGRKTQTRRVVKGGALDWLYSGLSNSFVSCSENALCPFGKVGDLLWVRECFSHNREGSCFYPQAHYWADGNPEYGDWTIPMPSIHMPRAVSRLTLEITNIRVERLHEISEDDARAEGVITEDWDEWRDDACSIGLPAGSSIENERDVFRDLWKSIHGPDAWEEGMNDPEVYLDHVGFYDPHLFRTAFNGPTKWCVLLPKLTDEDYGEVLCCDTLEEAEAACEERRKALGEKQ